jgi:hypothetical protein
VLFTRSELRLIGLTVVVTAAAAVTYYAKVGGSVVPFVISGAALALLASLVGRSVEALGGRLGAGATGVVQTVAASHGGRLLLANHEPAGAVVTLRFSSTAVRESPRV